MPEITGLRGGDPAEIGGYRLMGRLSSSVYAGRSRSGEPVAVRLLPTEMEPEPFLLAMERLQGVSAVTTAQILATGLLGEQAYVVSEYVEGPALEEAGGSLSEVGLHRLAVGTITALVAIHQAGLVHGDIRPGNVLLGPDGPRVINTGLEQAMTEAAISTRKVAVPAYTAPERLRGAGAEPPADVFSWAATMVFAATGAAPFDGGSMAATVDRIVHDAPTLPGNLGELHGLIVACLDKEPARRPGASEVLLRLVGQTLFLTGQVAPPVPQPPPPVPPLAVAGQETRPPSRRGRGLAALAAAFAAGALVSGASVYVLVDEPAPVRTVAAATPAPSTTPTVTSSLTQVPVEKVEAKAATDTKLPVVGATLHENPKDPVRLAAYLEVAGKYTSYVRDRSGAFKAVGMAEEPMVSPDGDWVALNPWLKFQNAEMDQVKFTRLSTGESFTVATVKKPLQTMIPAWSRDGRRLLLSVVDNGKPQRIVGFVLVDVAARKAVHVETAFTDNASLSFTFTPDGRIAKAYFDGKTNGIDFYSDSGQVIKSMHWVGLPRDRDWYSPSGKQFVTVCPGGRKDLCVWNAVTGDRLKTVPLADSEGNLLGWFDESHLLVQEPGKKKGTAQVKIIDLVGKTVRVLADVNPRKASLQFAAVPR
ncbi:serine/threonine-protein kinase [Nonomuraea sp. NPDC005650]|uniref:serine/threonine protein kinase n=1 Tax=Nonomuraea sp. NPDC005650 TaxID=3157045 RepID=UPI0033B5F826